jgi:hypothetical protein
VGLEAQSLGGVSEWSLILLIEEGPYDGLVTMARVFGAKTMGAWDVESRFRVRLLEV